MTLYCQICGAPFEYNGSRHPKYCSKDCIRERDRLSKRRSLDRQRAMYMPKGTLDTKLRILEERGVSYAQAQIAQTLAMIPKIGGVK